MCLNKTNFMRDFLRICEDTGRCLPACTVTVSCRITTEDGCVCSDSRFVFGKPSFSCRDFSMDFSENIFRNFFRITVEACGTAFTVVKELAETFFCRITSSFRTAGKVWKIVKKSSGKRLFRTERKFLQPPLCCAGGLRL